MTVFRRAFSFRKLFARGGFGGLPPMKNLQDKIALGGVSGPISKVRIWQGLFHETQASRETATVKCTLPDGA